MLRNISFVLRWAWLAVVMVSSHAQAVMLHQIDVFDAGSTADWQVGGDPSRTRGPDNVPGGGPAGPDDGFLRYTTDATNTGGRFLVINSAQWAGNYIDAGVTGISVSAKNLGQAELQMRLLLEGPGGAYFSLDAAPLAVDGDWQSVFFPISPSSLGGGDNLAGTLVAVRQIRLFHNPTASFPGPVLQASIGLDDIQAVPEPTGLLLGSVFFAIMIRWRLAGQQGKPHRQRPIRHAWLGLELR